MLYFLTLLMMTFGTIEPRAEEAWYSVSVEGTPRACYFFRPDSATRPSAVIIALHGGASRPEMMIEYSGLNQSAEKNGFAVAYPRGSGRFGKILTWNAGECCGYTAQKGIDDVEFITRLTQALVDKHDADPGRIYVTGISNGSMMAYRLALEIPERIAAVAGVAGGFQLKNPQPLMSMPIVHFHGLDDQFAPFEGGRGKRTSQGVVHQPMHAWVRVNHANPAPIIERLINLKADGTEVVRHTHSARPPDSPVVVYLIEGGGHTWPGQRPPPVWFGRSSRDISANELMWVFFREHQR